MKSAQAQTGQSFAQRLHFDAVIAFVPLHAACLLLFWTPFKASDLLWLAVTYAVRMFAITAGFHRYFSHRTFRVSRPVQFLLALLAQTSAQKGVLWWAAHHRLHHRHSDTAEDIHSPVWRGLWWSHMGWLVSKDAESYDRNMVRDLAAYPELRLLDKYHRLPAVALGALLFALGGLPAFLWGFVLSTVLLYHCTFSINSLSHLWGSRRYETRDQSRNNFLLALLTFGEGWHNNHHRFKSSARQGLLWWEIDITYYALLLLRWAGLIHDLRTAPANGRIE